MQVINPKVELIPELPPLEKVELCGRVCYKSEGKIEEGSARTFCERLLSRGHTSVFEHTRVVIPIDQYVGLRQKNDVQTVPDPFRIDFYNTKYGSTSHILLNGRDLINHVTRDLDVLAGLPSAPDYMTVRFTCDRAIANELVRHRVFSFSQESTRYVNYKEGIEFINPVPFDWAPVDQDTARTAAADPRYQTWFLLCDSAEKAYQTLIKEGCPPQEARTVLPLSTKTELVMTGTLSLWKVLIALRSATGAHPQARYLMQLLLDTEGVSEKLFGSAREVKIPEVDAADVEILSAEAVDAEVTEDDFKKKFATLVEQVATDAGVDSALAAQVVLEELGELSPGLTTWVNDWLKGKLKGSDSEASGSN